LKNKIPCAPFPHCNTYGILQGASPFLTSVIALTLILLGLFCLSPSILFARDIEDRSDNTEFRPVYSVLTSKKSGTTALLLESFRPLPGSPTVDLAHAPPVFARSAAAVFRWRDRGVQPFKLGLSPGQQLFRQPLARQVQERKSLFGAFRREFFIPVWGHAYAGNAKRGIPPAVATLGGFVAASALAPDEDDQVCTGTDNTTTTRTSTGVRINYSSTTTCTTEASGAFWVAFGAFIGGRIWGLISAVRTAKDYNRSIESENTATLSLFPIQDKGIGVAMNFRF